MANAFKKASWIWRQEAAGRDEFCDFLDTFTAEGAGKYTLRIAADSNYTVWMNGKLCAFGQYADYPHYKVYDEIDVSDFVVAGENRMVTVVWYYGIDSQTYKVGDAGLIYEVENAAGEVVVCTDESTLSRKSLDYVSGRGDLISGQLGPTYRYNLRNYDGFIESGAEGFEPSRTVATISTDFSIRPNKKLTLEERIQGRICRGGSFSYTTDSSVASANMQRAAVTIGALNQVIKSGDPYMNSPVRMERETADMMGVFFIVDLGEETTGFLDIDLELPCDCRVDVGYGEHLDDGVCRTSIRGFFTELECGAGRNTWLHTFRRFGCRYLQFFVHAPEVTVHYVGLRPTLYPLVHKDFKCGNLLRETIYKVCQNTLQQCLHEHYEDCPWREQALYALDSRNQMLCGYYAFDEKIAPRASLELIAHGVRPDGLLALCYPAGMDFPIPSYSCAYFLQMEEYIRYTGDTSLSAQYFDVLDALINLFHSKMQPEGVIENFYGPDPSGRTCYWNYYEGSHTMVGNFGETQRHLECPLNCYYSLAMQAFAKICDALGKDDYAADLRARVAKLNPTIAKVFYNPEVRLFETAVDVHRGTYAVLNQSLAILCGAADGLDTSLMLEIMSTNGHTDCGLPLVPNTLSLNSFRFDALLAMDREKYAPIILDELDREYLRMLRAGATTFWEDSLGADAYGGAGSLCHGWSALPVYYYEILTDCAE